MSQTAIFIVGVVVFALTVYGAVMAAGLALTKVEVEESGPPEINIDKKEFKRRFPFSVKY